MISLQSRKDAFRLLLPKEFLCKEIEQKYTEILFHKKGFFVNPIDFLNETIQRVQVLGFSNGTTQTQQQSSRGDKPLINPGRVEENNFMFPSGEYSYRSPDAPINLMDRTLNIEFRHTLGYLNYFMLFENFWYQCTRDRNYEDLNYNFNVDIINDIGEIYSRIVLMQPLVNGMDMLDFDFTQPTAQSGTFKVEFKYNNFDFQFITIEDYEKSEVEIEIGN